MTSPPIPPQAITAAAERAKEALFCQAITQHAGTTEAEGTREERWRDATT